MSFFEALVPFALFLALVAYLQANGYYAEDVAAPAPLCACNGACVAPEVPRTSEAPPAVPATPARASSPARATPLTAIRRPLAAAASPSPSPRTPRVWRNNCSTDKESVDSLLRWMSEKFLEEEEDEEEDP